MAALKKGENKLTAKANIDLDKSGLTSENCEIVHECGASPKSWKPSRSLNALSTLKKGNDYIIKAKQDVDIAKL